MEKLFASIFAAVMLVVAVGPLVVANFVEAEERIHPVCELTPETSGIEGSGKNGDAIQGVGGNSNYPIYAAFSNGAGGNVQERHILKKESTNAAWENELSLTPFHITGTTDMRPVSIWSVNANDIWVGLATSHPGEIQDNPNGPNLITNPGFETYTTSPGIPDSYIAIGTQTGVTHIRETSTVFEGSNAYRLQIDWNTGNGVRGISQTLPALAAGAYYTYNAKYYLPVTLNSATSVVGRVIDVTLNQAVTQNHLDAATPAGIWSDIIFGWKAEASHTYRIDFALSRGSTLALTESIIFDASNIQLQDSLGVRAFVHWDGVTWETVNIYNIPDDRYSINSRTGLDFRGIWGTASDNIYVVDNGALFQGVIGENHQFPQRIWHYDGTTWQAITHPAAYELITIFGFSETNIWTVGGERASQGTGFINVAEILHYNGVSWTDIAPPPGITKLEHLWGAAHNDLWAAGGDTNAGQIIHWNGVEWEDYTDLIPVSPVPAIRGIGGIDSNDVYFVGSNGLVLYWNGVVFTSVTSGTVTNLREVSYFEDVYIVGNNGSILHYVCALSHTNETIVNLWNLMPIIFLASVFTAFAFVVSAINDKKGGL